VKRQALIRSTRANLEAMRIPARFAWPGWIKAMIAASSWDRLAAAAHPQTPQPLLKPSGAPVLAELLIRKLSQRPCRG